MVRVVCQRTASALITYLYDLTVQDATRRAQLARDVRPSRQTSRLTEVTALVYSVQRLVVRYTC